MDLTFFVVDLTFFDLDLSFHVVNFVEACELEDGFAVDVALEELLYEIVETHTENASREDETFDVRIKYM